MNDEDVEIFVEGDEDFKLPGLKHAVHIKGSINIGECPANYLNIADSKRAQLPYYIFLCLKLFEP